MEEAYRHIGVFTAFLPCSYSDDCAGRDFIFVDGAFELSAKVEWFLHLRIVVSLSRKLSPSRHKISRAVFLQDLDNPHHFDRVRPHF